MNDLIEIDSDLEFIVYTVKMPPAVGILGVMHLGRLVDMVIGDQLLFGEYALCKTIGEKIYLLKIPCDGYEIPMIHLSMSYLLDLARNYADYVHSADLMMVPPKIMMDCTIFKVV